MERKTVSKMPKHRCEMKYYKLLLGLRFYYVTSISEITLIKYFKMFF